METEKVQQIWADITQIVKNDASIGPAFGAQLTLAIPRGLSAGMLYLAVQHDYTQKLLENQLKPTIMSAINLSDYAAEIQNFVVLVDPATAEPLEISDVAVTPEPDRALLDASPRENLYEQSNEVRPHQKPLLNEKYKFDTFVIGQSNRFAHAAAVAVAEAPAKAYNPLFIYGDSGLGKTHLLHAIGHYAQELYPNIRIRYVSTEDFTNDFINSIANNQGNSFHQRYRSVDILLVDDIQFLEGKAETQEAFFHTFNTLHAQNKQVVITSDVQPKQLNGFEERMLSRFEWGLQTDIQIPDLETRIAILRKKCLYENLVIEDSLLEYMASKLSSNIRELEGTLIRVAAYANLNEIPIDLELVQTVLKDVISLDENNEILPSTIITMTANYFNLPVEDLVGPSRAQEIAFARQIGMYLCRDLTSLSLPKIGQLFGGRDHTTVMYAHKKITQMITARRSVYNQISDLTTQIKQNS